MKVDLLGIKIDAVKKEDLKKKLEQIFKSKKINYIFTPNAEFVMRAQKDSVFKKILNNGALNLADGVGILWAAKYDSLPIPNVPVLKQLFAFIVWLFSLFTIIFYPRFIKKPIPERISGADFVWPLSQFAAENDYKIFLLGGASTIAERAALKLQTDIYGLKIAGVSSLDPQDRDQIIAQINKSNADILLVAYGSPKQEIWLKNNLKETSCILGVGVGGTFDFLAGTKKRAPASLRAIGLEWFYRLLLEPSRFKRQLAVPKLAFTMLFKKMFE